ncbi:MAG: SDR family NAD(P)-dependent oxidoreductase [Gammaproteobacteria bacterium]|nr:SDR family NAD(P)-dependent oxidoreductase [Gammaproteobacteria bacterium]
MTKPDSHTPDYHALMLNALNKIDALEKRLEAAQNTVNEPIAIVGMSCRFPGAETGLESFRQLLETGTDAITSMPQWRWQLDDYYAAEPESSGKMYVREGGFINNLDYFDAGFFDISPREAMAMDPQQRLWLEVCWEALEDAGIVTEHLYGTQTGVFVGASSFDFAAIMAKKLPLNEVDAYLGTGASLNILAGRLSYYLGLTGPSMALDSACSSSLLAVHHACQSLRSKECELALAGGVNAILAPETYVAFCQAGMLSPDARCKTFADNADGFIRSEGCGAVVLKRLTDAQQHGDRIWAVIRGSAVNQDGASGGLTVPSGPSQQAVIQSALTNAGIKPEQIDYIEAHGTGTPLGDPIEMRALAAVYGSNRHQKPVYIGSVKTNLGHLEAAAGIAGLIKTVLSLEQSTLYPHLHFSKPSSHIDWKSWPAKIPVERQPWPATDKPRTAAVSSFGLCGTNVHAILEQAIDAVPLDRNHQNNIQTSKPANLLLLTAKSFASLQGLASRYAQQVFERQQFELADICYSANSSRSRFNHRLLLMADSAAEFRQGLIQFAELENSQQALATGNYQLVSQSTQRIGLLFTGQGSQWAGMAKHMYGYYPEFTRQIDHCVQILKNCSDFDLKRLLIDEVGSDSINNTEYAQPALFAFEYAWTRQWLAWGIKPVCLLGHSLGEYVAACIAGVFNLEQGLGLIVDRARLMQNAPGHGGMAAVFASAKQLQALLGDYAALTIAIYNSSNNQVVSGTETELADFLKCCDQHGIEYTRLITSHGFHSSCMDSVVEEFSTRLSQIELNKAGIPIIANLTGRYETDCFASKDYWLQQLRQPVLFQHCVEALQQSEVDIMIEMGPKPVLTSLVMQQAEQVQAAAVCRADNTVPIINQAIANLVLNGVELNWQAFNAGQLISLPTYAWHKQRYWPEWFDNQSLSFISGYPWGRWITSTAWPENTQVYELELDVTVWFWLKQHQVYGLTIAPLALMISLIYQAMFMRDDDLGFVIEDLEIASPLLLPEQGVVILQLVLSHENNGFLLEVLSRQEATQGWQHHVSGRIHRADNSLDNTQTLEMDLHDPELIDGQQFDQSFAEHGLEYGHHFQGIEYIKAKDNCALARLNWKNTDMQITAPHPILLDLSMQLLAAIYKGYHSDLRLPVKIKHMQCFRQDFNDSMWLKGELNQSQHAEIKLFNSDHQLQFSMTGVELEPVSENQLKMMLTPARDWVYQTVWRPHSADINKTPQRWLLISDIPNLALADEMTKLGHCVTVIDSQHIAEADFSSVDEIVDLSALRVVKEPQHAMSFCAHVLQILNHLQMQAHTKVRLTLVTRQAVADFSQQINFAASALWGMAAVLFQEHSELNPRIIDCGVEKHLLKALLDSGNEQRLVVSSRGLKAQRLQHFHLTAEQKVSIDPKAAYLVTGGLGALGLVTVRWLIKQGARHLYLTTRQTHSKLPAELQSLQQLNPQTELVICTTDITRSEDVQQVFSDIEARDTVLKGIVHCAGFTDDDLLVNQSAARFQQLNQVKLTSATLLDRYSRSLPLDFFWLYSSLNVLLGTIGQGAYAAANAAMDALARQRNQDGFVALSINWGPWKTGIQEQHSNTSLQEHWRKSGLNLLDEDSAAMLFSKLLNCQSGQLSIADFNWQAISSDRALSNQSTLIQELIDVNDLQFDTVVDVDMTKLLGAEFPEQRRSHLTEWIKQQLTRILKLPLAQLDIHQPLNSMGFDSLAAVELRSQMRKFLQIDVPVNHLLQTDTSGLIDYLEKQMSLSEKEEENTMCEQDLLEGEL